MPNNRQSWKRLRQAKKQNLRNRQIKSEIKTYTKKLVEAVESDEVTEAETLLRTAQAKLDKAMKKGTLHRNTVNRRKSQLSTKVQALKKS